MSDEPAKAEGTEGELEKIKASIEKYSTGDTEPTAKALGDLTKAVRDLSDQVATHERRLKSIEDSHPEWTTHGWIPPAGSDIPPPGSEAPPP